MDNYYEMEAERKSNSRRLKQIRKGKHGSDVYAPNERTSTFSLRMILVMLILSVTMFLKQVQVLDHSSMYERAMSEMQKQLTIDDIRKTVQHYYN